MDDYDMLMNRPRKKNRWRLLFTVLNLSFYLCASFFMPKLTVSYYENQGYTFPDNTGFISQNIYQHRVENPNLDMTFTHEIPIQVDRITLNNDGYWCIYSSHELFEVGMMSNFIGTLVDFHAYDFLFGTAFTNDHEVVLTESIAATLLGEGDRTGETITIAGVDFTVSGIVKAYGDRMDFIYLSEANASIVTSDPPMIDYIIFQDDNLHMKLYERGDYDLVSGVSTRTNQFTINSTSKSAMLLATLIFSLISFLIEAIRKKEVIEEAEIPKNKSSDIVRLLISVFIITMFLCYLVFGAMVFNVHITSFPVAYLFVMSYIPKFFWVFGVYLIPIICFIVRKIKKRSNQRSA